MLQYQLVYLLFADYIYAYTVHITARQNRINYEEVRGNSINYEEVRRYSSEILEFGIRVKMGCIKMVWCGVRVSAWGWEGTKLGLSKIPRFLPIMGQMNMTIDLGGLWGRCSSMNLMTTHYMWQQSKNGLQIVSVATLIMIYSTLVYIL